MLAFSTFPLTATLSGHTICGQFVAKNNFHFGKKQKWAAMQTCCAKQLLIAEVVLLAHN